MASCASSKRASSGSKTSRPSPAGLLLAVEGVSETKACVPLSFGWIPFNNGDLASEPFDRADPAADEPDAKWPAADRTPSASLKSKDYPAFPLLCCTLDTSTEWDRDRFARGALAAPDTVDLLRFRFPNFPTLSLAVFTRGTGVTDAFGSSRFDSGMLSPGVFPIVR